MISFFKKKIFSYIYTIIEHNYITYEYSVWENDNTLTRPLVTSKRRIHVLLKTGITCDHDAVLRSKSRDCQKGVERAWSTCPGCETRCKWVLPTTFFVKTINSDNGRWNCAERFLQSALNFNSKPSVEIIFQDILRNHAWCQIWRTHVIHFALY